MLKWIGAALGLFTIVWIVLQRETVSWASLSAGLILSSALFIMLSLAKPEKPQKPPTEDKLQWQAKLDEVETKASQTIDGLNREVQKLQLKSIRSEERCLSYQKLVEVHQQEIEKLRQENQALAEELIQKERKLSELYLSRMEPDLFDVPRLDTKKKKKPITAALESRDLLS